MTALYTATPESQGVSSSAISEMIDAIEENDLQVTNFVLLRNGKKIAQFCRKPYKKDDKQLLFSLTKSFTGIGVGIAYDKGLLSLEDSVISFFPGKTPGCVSNNLKDMKVKHLLSMSCGISKNTYYTLYPQIDWVEAFLSQEFPCKPGSLYIYSTHASYMLAAIVERITNRSFYVFLKENLFTPLDIKESMWEVCSQGITAGGMGLSLSVESIAKFGQMLLDKGVYDNKRIVSEEYLKLATSKQITKSEPARGYGYQFHIDENGCFYGDGAFGQLCYIVPEQNIVLVTTSRKKNGEQIKELLHEKILLGASGCALPPSNEYVSLMDRLDKICYPTPRMYPLPAGTKLVCGTYVFMENPHGLRTVSFKSTQSSLTMYMKYDNREDSQLEFSFNGPVYGNDIFVKDIQFHHQPYISYVSRDNANIYTMTLFYIETPYVASYRFRTDGDEISMDFEINASLNLKNFACKGLKIK